MINELFELSKSLDKRGLLQSTTHPDVGNVGKGHCVIFELGSDGMPSRLRYLQPEETAVLWKHSKGNWNSFPAIRLQHPLLAESQSSKVDDDAWNKAGITGKIDMLAGLDCSSVNPECKEICISEWTLQHLRPVADCDIPELAALKKLVSVFPKGDGGTEFVLKLIRTVMDNLVRCQQKDEIDFLKKILIGARDRKTGKFKSECMTYYDLSPTDDFANIVASSETQRALIRLLNSAASREETENSIVSPLSGMTVAAMGDKYPNPNIPLLGLTYLFSKKADTPCLTRYEMSGTDAYRVGKGEVSAINDAVAFLTQPSRKNKTWRAMTDSNREKPDLLLAYLADDPQNDAYLAKVLGDPSDYDDLDEFKDTMGLYYDALCQQVLGGLEDALKKNRWTKVNLILLETLDPGRKQIAYETSFTAERLRSNLLEWRAAYNNIPPVVFKRWENKEVQEVSPICPGPMEICQLLKTSYTRSGPSKPMKQSEVSLHEIYSLYMPSTNSDRSEDLIDIFLERSVRKSLLLLGDVGCGMTLAYVLPSTSQVKAQVDSAAKFVALISILLYFKGIGKESFMLDAAFNVGQFLQLSDKLHREYCIQVRNGGEKNTLPPQLMGNEMLPIAAEAPVEGLNRLRDRMKVYLAWAYTTTGKDAGYAKWILARLGEVSLKIAEHELPERFDPAQQAQVLLGYLASIPYDKDGKNVETQKEGNDE